MGDTLGTRADTSGPSLLHRFCEQNRRNSDTMSEPVEIQIFPFDEDINSPAILLPGETAAQSVMADPFEVRMRFTSQLQHLNASVNSSQKAAHYALKYRDMDEDLHSCILEQLERVSGSSSTPLILLQHSHLINIELHEQPRQHHVLHRAPL